MTDQPKQTDAASALPFAENGGEKLLQFIWQFGYFNSLSLTTTDGEAITIIFRGTPNKNQGPDFTAAKIKIGNTTLVGNIEIHTKTSEWLKHKHEEDQQYKNVILHVVFVHDKVVNAIPVVELSSRVSTLLLKTYSSFMNNGSFIPCGNSIIHVKAITWQGWKERLLAERLTRKSTIILQLLQQAKFHWEEAFWWLVARNFGGKINGEAFEAVAKSIPITVLAKHKSSIHQLEAMLLGQANLLNTDFEDEYPRLLQREYSFLKKKYKLKSSVFPVLFLRMRPGNFPTIRLAQLAVLLQQASHLFSKIIEADHLAEVKNLFRVTANDFWHYHYTFGQPSAFKKKALGTDTIDNLMINSVAPLLFSYGIYHSQEKYKDKALRWLEELPAETNHVTKEFEQAGIKSSSALDSQALLELKNEYCHYKKCLDCAVGNNLLREAAQDYRAINVV